MDNIPPPSDGPGPQKRVGALPAWARPVLALAGAVIVVAGAIGIGSTFYYQVHPLGAPSTPAEGQPAPHADPVPFAQAFSSASIAETQQQQCEYFSADDPSHRLSTSTLSQMGHTLCTLFVQKGTSIIQHPLTGGAPSLFYGGDGAYNGLGIVVSDRPYLISFSLIRDESGQYHIALNRAIVLHMADVSALTLVPIKSVVEGSQLARVAGTDASGKPSEAYFGQYSGRYSDGGFSIPIAKNSDGSFSNIVSGGYNTDPADVSFLMPYTIQVTETTPDRDFQMEAQHNVSPMYHKAACGLEESYGDMAFYDGSQQTKIAINFGYKPTLHITTAVQGYVPEQWGTVLSTVSFGDFKTRAQTAKAYNSNAPVDLMTINGYAVKHVGPITPDRTCQYQPNVTYDMYYALKNGAVVTFTLRHDNVQPNNETTDAQKLISQVLESLTFSRR